MTDRTGGSMLAEFDGYYEESLPSEKLGQGYFGVPLSFSLIDEGSAGGYSGMTLLPTCNLVYRKIEESKFRNCQCLILRSIRDIIGSREYFARCGWSWWGWVLREALIQ
jgi:hypothetical protein